MNKRGQFFLIAALVTMFVVYTLVIEYNTIREYVALEDFEDISENYQTEQPKVINKAIAEGVNEKVQIDDFTSKFLDYAGDKDPNFGILSIYVDSQGIIHIINKLNNKVLHIKSETSEEVITLLSFNTLTPGEICIKGIGCNTVKTNTDKFGKEFFEQEFKDITILYITIRDGDTGKVLGFYPLNLESFKNENYLESEEPTEFPETPVIKVSCTGCPKQE